MNRGIVCVVHAFVHLVLYVLIHHAGPREKGSSQVNAPDLPDVLNFDTNNMAGAVCRAPLYWRKLDVTLVLATAGRVPKLKQTLRKLSIQYFLSHRVRHWQHLVAE